MTKIKFCGLFRDCDAEYANELMPEYAGFVLVKIGHRQIDAERASELRKMLRPEIKTVGVFVDEDVNTVAELLESGIIDLVQLHGSEDDKYIETLKKISDKPVIKAFKISSEADVRRANESSADYVLLDSGTGSGKLFDWDLLSSINREYFLAGGLNPENAGAAVERLKPYAVDVSSGIETDKVKDRNKMAAFAAAVRNTGGNRND